MSLPDKRVRGGPPSHLYLLHDCLIELGADVRNFIYGGRTHDEGAARKLLGRLFDLICFPVLLFRHWPHVVHLNSGFDKKGILRDIFFVPTARLFGHRVLIKFHGSDVSYLHKRGLLWALLSRVVVRGSDVVCVLNREEQRVFENCHPNTRCAVVKNALDFSRYRQTEDFRAKHGIPIERPLLLFIARFIATKGLRETILALPVIRQRHDVHAAFVGDGPVRAECEALCRELQLEPYTTFTGYIPEEQTVNAYLASDMLVFPTYHNEGMPMVIFHSLACGLPVITTRIRAAADWLEEGKHSLFVPPRDPEKVAQAVIHLLDHPELIEDMKRNGKALARKFEKRAVAGEFLSLYESLLNNRNG